MSTVFTTAKEEGLVATHRRSALHYICVHALMAALLVLPAFSQQVPGIPPDNPSDNTLDKNVEDLMNVEVTSVSRKEQKISRTAAAIFVITGEDIRRSGAVNIPDLLRMVPGLDVAQINANTWAISARGFNHELSDKLLVLIDGRTVYTPIFGAVNWDTQDVLLEDIERIEVIRGPGATVWGANAVNGVINIITKKAEDTPGGLLTAGGGTQARALGAAQYGGRIGPDFNYRVFTKYLNTDHTPDVDSGDSSQDGWYLLHGGFRVDGKLSPADSLTIQGDIYSGNEGAEITHTTLNPPENVTIGKRAALEGGNILGRWDHSFSNGSDATLQFYFDRKARFGPESNESIGTVDFDFQHRVALSLRNDFIWGLGFRRSDDNTTGTIDQAYVPAAKVLKTFSSFVQDEITLKPSRLFLTIGTKLEHVDFTGFNLSPSVRLAWTPNLRNTFWAAVSRANRTPSRVDTAANIALAAFPGADGSTQELVLFGNPQQKDEHVIAYELGYRTQPAKRFSLDVATFFNSYSNLRTQIEGTPFFLADPNEPRWIIPFTWANTMYGKTFGVEVSADWKVRDRWTLSSGYTLLEMRLHTEPGTAPTITAAETEGSSPQHQVQLRSHVDLKRGWSWDSNAYFVSALPAQQIPFYVRLDTQLRWRIGEGLEWRLVGQNLLQDHHVESNDILTIVNASQVKRGAYAAITWRF